MSDISLPQLVALLKGGPHSLVVAAPDRAIYLFDRHGIADLFDLLTLAPEVLRGALVADKVVDRGAAAIMAVGGVSELHALTLSHTAAELLDREGVAWHCDRRVDSIATHTAGMSALEQSLARIPDAAGCIPVIAEAIDAISC